MKALKECAWQSFLWGRVTASWVVCPCISLQALFDNLPWEEEIMGGLFWYLSPSSASQSFLWGRVKSTGMFLYNSLWALLDNLSWEWVYNRLNWVYGLVSLSKLSLMILPDRKSYNTRVVWRAKDWDFQTKWTRVQFAANFICIKANNFSTSLCFVCVWQHWQWRESYLCLIMTLDKLDGRQAHARSAICYSGQQARKGEWSN